MDVSALVDTAFTKVLQVLSIEKKPAPGIPVPRPSDYMSGSMSLLRGSGFVRLAGLSGAACVTLGAIQAHGNSFLCHKI